MPIVVVNSVIYQDSSPFFIPRPVFRFVFLLWYLPDRDYKNRCMRSATKICLLVLVTACCSNGLLYVFVSFLARQHSADLLCTTLFRPWSSDSHCSVVSSPDLHSYRKVFVCTPLIVLMITTQRNAFFAFRSVPRDSSIQLSSASFRPEVYISSARGTDELRYVQL